MSGTWEPPSRRNIRIAEQVDDLFDFAAEHQQDGFTYQDVKTKFGWQRNHFIYVGRKLRNALDGDRENLVCTSQGKGRPWLYQLTGDPEVARFWTANRI